MGATIAWANFVLFSWVLIFALITQKMFDQLGAGYTFLLFAMFNAIAALFMGLKLKDVSTMTKCEKKACYSSSSGKI